jgi:hypothetical protein
MSDLASIPAAPSALNALSTASTITPSDISATPNTAAATPDETGGFQALMALQSASLAPPVASLVTETPAPAPAPETTKPTSTTLALGLAQIGVAAAPAQTGTLLPPTGKTLPPVAAAPTDAPSDDTPAQDTTSTLDPALGLMLNAVAQNQPTAPQIATPSPAPATSATAAPIATPTAAPIVQTTIPAPAAQSATDAASDAPTQAEAPPANAVTLRPDQIAAQHQSQPNRDGHSGDPSGQQKDAPDRQTSDPLTLVAAQEATPMPTLAEPAAAILPNMAPPTISTSATLAPAAPSQGPDMAALVDRLVEARQAARMGAGPQSVTASVTHAEFGRVALNFRQDEDGLSVSMASNDPTFAPAAQAALLQSQSVTASAASSETNSNSDQRQPQTQSQTAQTATNSQNPQGQQNQQSPQGQQPQTRNTQIAANPGPANSGRPNPTQDTNAALSQRAGILA